MSFLVGIIVGATTTGAAMFCLILWLLPKAYSLGRKDEKEGHGLDG